VFTDEVLDMIRPRGPRATFDDDVFSVDLPGVAEKDLDVKIDRSLLTVSGKRNDKEFTYHWRLPYQVDASQAEASLKLGVLSIEFAPANTTKQIPVKTG